MTTDTENWRQALAAVANKEKTAILSRFFKTGKGEYGEGDIFIGVTVPYNRKVAKTFAAAPFPAIEEMLRSDVHEHRLSALLALVERYGKAKGQTGKDEVEAFYLSHTSRINNWNLVDLSAPAIVGDGLLRHPGTDPTGRLCESRDLWEQRIAVVATLRPIRAGIFGVALRNISRLLHHPHDLIQKANGWMLREIGKRDEAALTGFLDRHAAEMPRVTLRYAIERLTPAQRRAYMKLPRQN